MGQTKGPYNAEFVRGLKVRVRDAEFLGWFRKSWAYHHPLQPEQLAYAGMEAEVATTSVYHGGDLRVLRAFVVKIDRSAVPLVGA
jgi:hypothetical protein